MKQREIKFRAWDKKGKIGIVDNPRLDVVLEDDRYIVMQYTGLKDKNKKEIYEGDIVKRLNQYNQIQKGEVAWHEAGFKVLFKGDVGLQTQFLDLSKDLSFDLEVIGNIYENYEKRIIQ